MVVVVRRRQLHSSQFVLTRNSMQTKVLDMIGSNDEALRSPCFEGIFPPLDLLLRADADTLVHLCTSSENLGVGREAVADVILHHFRTFQGLDRDQFAGRSVVGMRDNAMLLGVLGRFGIGIECLHYFLNICVGLDNMRVETCGWTVCAGRASNMLSVATAADLEKIHKNVRRSSSQN